MIQNSLNLDNIRSESSLESKTTSYSLEIRENTLKHPFFSVCIPQYNRTSFLLEACKSLEQQTFRDFEVCISDDCSTDGRESELVDFLKQSGLSFVYRRQERNRRYDGNLRASIDLARGEFCFLLGNDDSLASPTTLADLSASIQQFGPASVVITNYEDFATGRRFNRISETGIMGSGPEVAASTFRNYSFVSGILLETTKAKKHATAKWDSSEMYQMFIGSRIVAEGGPLLGLNTVTIHKEIRIPGEEVDSYAAHPRLDPCPIEERKLPMRMLGRLVVDAIEPYLNPSDRWPMIRKTLLQVFLFTYPFWLFEYRRVQSWKYALGVCLGMRPRNTLRGLKLSDIQRMRLSAVHAIVSIGGLMTPLWIFDKMYPALYSLAKSAT